MIFRLTYDGHLVPLSNVKDLPEVGRGEDRAARVGGRVDDDGGSVVVDEGLHVAKVDHPVVVGEKVVLPGLNSQPGREGGVEGKARTGHQNVLTVVSKSRDGNVQGTRATRAQDHIVRGHLMHKESEEKMESKANLASRNADMLCNGCSCFDRACAWTISGEGKDIDMPSIETSTHPLHFCESRALCKASITSLAGRRLPNTVGSPMLKEIIFFSGFGAMFIVSRMFLIGLKVFLATMEALTFHSSREAFFLSMMMFSTNSSSSVASELTLRTIVGEVRGDTAGTELAAIAEPSLWQGLTLASGRTGSITATPDE